MAAPTITSWDASAQSGGPYYSFASGTYIVDDIQGDGFDEPNLDFRFKLIGQAVFINGSNIFGFNGFAYSEFDCTGATVGTYQLQVSTDDGTFLFTGQSFDIIVPPDVTAITPSTGVNTGSVSITNLAGSGFTGTSPVVKLKKSGEPDINASSVVQVTSIRVTCTINLIGIAGTWNVFYQDSHGNDTLIGGFTITDPVPDITSIAPSTGANSGTTSITNLAGTYLSGTSPVVKLKKTGESDITATNVQQTF